MEMKEKKVSVDELIAMVNSQGKDFIIHVEFDYPSDRMNAMKEYAAVNE